MRNRYVTLEKFNDNSGVQIKEVVLSMGCTSTAQIVHRRLSF